MKLKRPITILLQIALLFLIYEEILASVITGKVTDSQSQPLPGVTLLIQGTTIGTITNPEGHFEIKNVASGRQVLIISSLGYERTMKEIFVPAGETIKLDIVMRDATSTLDEIVIEGQSIKKELETRGFAVHVIETKKASLQSVQTNDLINRTAGVRVRQNGGIGSSVDYNLNGMSGNSVRIFIDGLPASTYGSSFSLNSIPPALIERIEIYKGVIPAHLADDALGGAINVILKKSMSNNLSASVSYGSFNTFQTNFNGLIRESSSGFTLRASAFYNYSDNDYEVWGKFVRNILPNGRYDYVRAKRFNDAYKSVGGKLSVGSTSVKWADQLFISYTGSDDYNEIQHGTYMSIPYFGRFTTSQSHALGLDYSKEDLFTKGLEVTFNGTLSSRGQVVNDTVRWNYNWFGERSLGLDGKPILRPQGAQQGAPTLNHIDRNIATFRTGLNYRINSQHKLIYSFTYFDIDRRQQDEMLSTVERAFIGTRDLQKDISSLGYEFNLFRTRLKGNLFGKYYQQRIDRMDPILVEANGESFRSEDRVSSTKNTAGYGAAFSYTVSEKLLLLISAEKAVRMPSENEIFGSPGDNIVENISINPEISNNLNLGFQVGSFDFVDHKFSLSSTGFLRDTKDKIIQQINPRINDAVQTNPYENLGKTKSIGFEAQLNYSHKDKLRAMINLSRFNSVFNTRYDSNGNIYDNYNQQLPNEPYFNINSTLEYAFADVFMKEAALNLTYYFGFVDRFYTTWLEIEDFRTPRQFVQDIGVNYAFPNKKLVISGDVRNIFDQQVYDNFAVQKPGRAFYLKINYTINNF